MLASSSTPGNRFRTACAALLLALSVGAPAARAADPLELEWREPARGVWSGVRPTSYRQPVVGNTVIVIGRTGVLVFDAAGFPLEGERLGAQGAPLTSPPVPHPG